MSDPNIIDIIKFEDPEEIFDIIEFIGIFNNFLRLFVLNNNKINLNLFYIKIIFQYNDLKFLIFKKGEGNFGTVVKAKHKENEQVFAIKIIPMD